MSEITANYDLSAKHLFCAHCIGNVQDGRLILYTQELLYKFFNSSGYLATKVAEEG
jgi:hypothetical protein